MIVGIAASTRHSILFAQQPSGGTVESMAMRPNRRTAYEFDVLSGPDDDSFLGTLPTEASDEAPLDGAFAEVYARFVSLRDAYLSGRIGAMEFGGQARDLRVLDEDGLYWTLGATTMRWYAFNPHDATQWISSPTPGKSGVVVDAEGRPAGWAVEDWQARRAERAAERRAQGSAAAGGEPRGGAQPRYGTEAPTVAEAERRRRMTIDEMFNRYVDDGSGRHYAVESSILAAEDLDGTDRDS